MSAPTASVVASDLASGIDDGSTTALEDRNAQGSYRNVLHLQIEPQLMELVRLRLRYSSVSWLQHRTLYGRSIPTRYQEGCAALAGRARPDVLQAKPVQKQL